MKTGDFISACLMLVFFSIFQAPILNAGTVFVLDEITNTAEPSCVSDQVKWEVLKGGVFVDAGRCLEEEMNSPLFVGPRETIKGKRCSIPELEYPATFNRARCKWCGNTVEFVYGTAAGAPGRQRCIEGRCNCFAVSPDAMECCRNGYWSKASSQDYCSACPENPMCSVLHSTGADNTDKKPYIQCGSRCGGVSVLGYPVWGVKECAKYQSCENEECVFKPFECCTKNFCAGKKCDGADQHCVVDSNSCFCQRGVYIKVASIKEIKNEWQVAQTVEYLLSTRPDLDLIVLPEYSLYPSFLEWPPWGVLVYCEKDTCRIDEEGSDEYVVYQIKELMRLAQKYKVNIVFGTVATKENIRGKWFYFNSALVIDSSGSLVAKKMKVSGLDWCVPEDGYQLDYYSPWYADARNLAIKSSGPIHLSDRAGNRFSIYVSICDDIYDSGTFEQNKNAAANILVWTALISDPPPPDVLLLVPRDYGVVREDGVLVESNFFRIVVEPVDASSGSVVESADYGYYFYGRVRIGA